MEFWNSFGHCRKKIKDLLWISLVVFPINGMTEFNHIKFIDSISPIEVTFDKNGLPVYHFSDGREAEVRLERIEPFEFYIKMEIIESTCAIKKIDNEQLRCQISIPIPDLQFNLVWTKNPLTPKKIGETVKFKNSQTEAFSETIYSINNSNSNFFSKMKCTSFSWMGLSRKNDQGLISDWTTELMIVNSETDQNMNQAFNEQQNIKFKKLDEKNIGFEWPLVKVRSKTFNPNDLFFGDNLGWTLQVPGQVDLCEVSMKVDILNITSPVLKRIENLNKTKRRTSFKINKPEWQKIVRNLELNNIYSYSYEYEIPSKYYWPLLFNLYDRESSVVSTKLNESETTVTFRSKELL